jgi:hypothetical protein
MWKALCGLMICWSAITASSSPLDHSPLPPPLPLPQIQSAPLRYCSLTVAICRRKTAYITDQSPASLAGIWSCICWAESRDTNTSEGDGGGYFQFEPVTWAWLTKAPWPPTMYSFSYQYSMARKLQQSIYGWSPWSSDGCV